MTLRILAILILSVIIISGCQGEDMELNELRPANVNGPTTPPNVDAPNYNPPNI